MYNFNKDLIYFIKRDGVVENPYKDIEEKVHVLYEKAFLQEVPTQSFRVSAKVGETNLIEVNRIEDIVSTNHYFVNYKQGIVYFHSSMNNTEVELTYRGQGILLYPASRIYIDSEDGVRDVVKTLKDLINEGRTALDAVEEVDRIITNAEDTLEGIDVAVLSIDDAIERIDLKNTEIVNAENARATQESTRKSNEDSRKAEEIKRVQAETQRNTNESDRNTAENQRQTDEQSRKDAEALRNTDEGKRKDNETDRVEKEGERQSAEELRNASEEERNTEESKRNTQEGLRQTAEQERNSSETIREENEQDRIAGEVARENAESARNTKEQERITSETLRSEAEELRKSQETKRQQDTVLAIENAEKATASANTVIKNANDAISDIDALVENTKYIEVFSSTTTYVKNNIVSYNGSSYIAKDTTVGNLPTNEIYWGLLAQRGIDGDGSVSSVNNILPDLDGNINIDIESLGAEKIVNKSRPNGYAGLDSNGKIPLSQVPDTLKQRTYVVSNEAERLALTDLMSGDKAFEKETGDSYIYDGLQWHIMADADWENVSLDWTNIANKPNSSVVSIDKAVTDSHTHGNKSVLDGFTVVDGKLKHNDLNIGNVDSVNGKTGAVTITPQDIGAYTKQDVDALIDNHTSIEVVDGTPTTLDKIGVLYIKKSVIDAETPE